MAATTIATMAMINAKSMINISSSTSSSSTPKTLMTTNSKYSKLPTLSLPKPPTLRSTPSTLASTAIAGAIFSTLSSCDAALAAQQIAELAEGAGDNRGLALLLPIIPALAWVLFNILQPALNQINKMANSKGVIVGLGLGSGLAAAGLLSAPEASAAGEEIAHIAAEAAAAGGDSRGQLLLLVVAPAILWVLYNILQPALNQINKMRS